MSAETELLEIIKSGKECPVSTLMPLFNQLQPVSADFMIGSWHGGKFDGGKPDKINWYGKKFVSREHVEPLIAQKPDGTIYSYDGLGMAQLREVAYEGKVSACLIYDKYAMMDYFRKVTDNIVIGAGEIKGQGIALVFHLTRE